MAGKQAQWKQEGGSLMLDSQLPPYSTPALALGHLLVPGGHVGCTPSYNTAVQLSAGRRRQQHLVGVDWS